MKYKCFAMIKTRITEIYLHYNNGFGNVRPITARELSIQNRCLKFLHIML